MADRLQNMQRLKKRDKLTKAVMINENWNSLLIIFYFFNKQLPVNLNVNSSNYASYIPIIIPKVVVIIILFFVFLFEFV